MGIVVSQEWLSVNILEKWNCCVLFCKTVDISRTKLFSCPPVRCIFKSSEERKTIRRTNVVYSESSRMSHFYNLFSDSLMADPERTRLTFLRDDGQVEAWSGRRILETVASVSRRLRSIGRVGDRVLLLYPPGLDFIAGFLGCVHAGMLAVPVSYPKLRRPLSRYNSIIADCHPAHALTTADTLRQIDSKSLPITWIASDAIEPGDIVDDAAQKSPDEILFLQYTSGSTSDPKGVCVTHKSLAANLKLIQHAYQIFSLPAAERIVCSWLPGYHDMGLIGTILAPLISDGHAVLMSPAAFLQRPSRWLQAMSDYSARVTVAPCFAYDLCTRVVSDEQAKSLDLHDLYLAGCGAEPISADVLDRFARRFASTGFNPEAFYPCYGLAESTLFVTGATGPHGVITKSVCSRSFRKNRIVAPADPGSTMRVVSCGIAHGATDVRIVDPQTCVELPDDQVGEIWLKSDSVAGGYWKKDRATQMTFDGTLAGGPGGYLRTGDLGFRSDRQIYVTGRIKDLIIIRGQNHYPQDIENTASQSHVALTGGAGAAFSVDLHGEEQLVLVHELSREHRSASSTAVLRALRLAIAHEHELNPLEIVLVRPGSIPRTTSGKIQRFLCREQYLAGELQRIDSWRYSKGRDRSLFPDLHLETSPSSELSRQRVRQQIESVLMAWLRQEVANSDEEISPQQAFAEFGVDSLTAVELSRQLEDWLRIEISPVVAWSYPTPEKLSEYLAMQALGVESRQADEDAVDVYADMIRDIENMTDEEVDAQLSQIRGE